MDKLILGIGIGNTIYSAYKTRFNNKAAAAVMGMGCLAGVGAAFAMGVVDSQTLNRFPSVKVLSCWTTSGVLISFLAYLLERENPTDQLMEALGGSVNLLIAGIFLGNYGIRQLF